MKEIKIESQEGDSISFEKEISNLMQEQLLFTESIYVHLPMGELKFMMRWVPFTV